MPANPPGRNSFATPSGRGDGSAPNPSNEFIWAGPGRYSVPSVDQTTDPDYTLGFSPTLQSGGSPDGSSLPDDIRLNRREPPGTAESHTSSYLPWQRKRNSEKLQRQLDDHTETMWDVKQQKVSTPRYPIWDQERAPTRPTADNSPTGYAFQRPWHIPRNVKDVLGEDAVAHFSMADHRRKYEIMTQKPQGRLGVNTYRASPRPWDENLFIPPPAGHSPAGIAGNRPFRLG